MARFTITPWRAQSDLLSVRTQLYDLDEDQHESRRSAVNRVMAWKLRGNLPHAVESTALLVDAILHHDIPGNSIFSIRAVYSAAFTRFVTGFCDIGRNRERSLEPSSMLDIAKQIGMPAHFVAIRHEATHEELPNVQRLVAACKEALEWLWNVYWSRLEEAKPERHARTDFPAVRAETRLILKTFRSDRLEMLKSQKRQPQALALNQAVESCIRSCHGVCEGLETLITVLVDEKFLSPSKRALGSSLEGAFLIWDDFLKALVTKRTSFIDSLVASLLQASGGGGASSLTVDLASEAHAQWLLHILTDAEWSTHVLTKRRPVLLKQVMQWCCTHPGQWTRIIGQQLLEAADQDFREIWKDILEASHIMDEAPSEDVSGKSSNAALPLTENELLTRFTRYESQVQQPQSNWLKGPVPLGAPIGVVAR